MAKRNRTPYLKGPVETRFWPKVEKTPACWTWTASLSQYGYGQFNVDGHCRFAHRVAYELLVGPIPDGLVLDHLCRNRACCNPLHLEPVTLAENKRRGESAPAVNATKSHCLNGHPFDDANTWVNPKTGYRKCRKCNAIRQSAIHARRRNGG